VSKSKKLRERAVSNPEVKRGVPGNNELQIGEERAPGREKRKKTISRDSTP